VSKGLNQSIWDFRLETTTPVKLKESKVSRYGSPDWGALALPGKYSVSIYQFENGKLEKLTEPTSFTIKMIHQDQISKADANTIAAYVEKVAEGRRQMRVMLEEVKAIGTSLKYMENAVLQTPKADPKWLEEMDAMNKQLSALKIALYGDYSRSKREMEAYPGIADRIEIVVDNLYSHTEAPTNAEQKSYEIAMAELKVQQAAYAKLKAQMNEMAQRLKTAKSPYVPTGN
jgi:hypothetical protein